MTKIFTCILSLWLSILEFLMNWYLHFTFLFTILVEAVFLETFQKGFFGLTCFPKSTFDDFCSTSSYSKLCKCLICCFLCHICGLLCLICHFLCLFSCLICGLLCLFWCRICCLLGLKCYLQYLFCGLLCLFRCLFRVTPVVEFEGTRLMGLYHFASRKKMTNNFFKNVSRTLLKIYTC